LNPGMHQKKLKSSRVSSYVFRVMGCRFIEFTGEIKNIGKSPAGNGQMDKNLILEFVGAAFSRD
jgi:hypothetical protein